jgi:hypothetical protein
MRDILLIEPNYKNKYPPIGLMKLATYHRRLGDNVRFFKGDLNDFVLSELVEECLQRLNAINNLINWSKHFSAVKLFIKTGRKEELEKLLKLTENDKPLVYERLNEYSRIFRKKLFHNFPKWDRVYVTTLFTFYWKVTVETIHFAKHLVKKPEEIYVGGVLASLLHNELYEETGIMPMKGLLDSPGVLDKDNDIIIDNLPLDYSILDEIDYEYPTKSAYFTFMTKGCTRKCAFCSVPILEPTYKPKIDTIDKFHEIKELYGEQQNLLLMDNNVLASPKFPEIIEEIKEMGFTKGATYIEPNQLDIAVKNLSRGLNDSAYIKRCNRLLDASLARQKGEQKQRFYNVLDKYKLLSLATTTKENLLLAYPDLKEAYEKYRNKVPRLRYVDFNQGTDARYVTDDLMRLMSEIPIRPLRLAFDHIGIKKQYIKAVELAAKYDIRELSNYILYNFQDKPEDLYNRLQINIDLCREHNIAIFSFPMKYIPLFGEDAKHREFTGKHWNKKYIRAIQSILNVTKGIVAPAGPSDKSSFFEEAFGRNLEEYFEILLMPETYIIYRHVFRYKLGYTDVWRDDYNNLEEIEKEEAKQIVLANDFSKIESLSANPRIIHFLRHYTITRGSIYEEDPEYPELKAKYDKMILEDQFIDLTLTYDFEQDEAPKHTKHTRKKREIQPGLPGIG